MSVEHSPQPGERLLQIGEVAERSGLSLRTLRYWEEVGLVEPSARTEGRFRLYAEGDLERVLLLKQMKPLGLTLDEMGALADVIERSGTPRGLRRGELQTVVGILSEYASRTDEAIEKLERGLTEARQLRLRIGESLSRSEVTLEHAPTRS